MARYGKINQKQIDNTPGTDGQFLRRVSGLYVPYTLQAADIPPIYRAPLLLSSTRDLVATDANKHLYSESTSTWTVTVPTAIFSGSAEIEFSADSTGDILITPGAGFTINGASTAVICSSGTSGYLKFRSPSSARWYGAPQAYVEKNKTFLSDATARSFQLAGVQTVNSIVIPGGTVKPNGFIDFEIIYKGVGTGAKVTTISFGGVTIITISSATVNLWYTGRKIFNRNNTNVATAPSNFTSYGNVNASPVTAAVNWLVDQTFLISVNVTTAAQGIDVTYVTVRTRN